MLKSELVLRIAERHALLSQRDAERVVDGMLEQIALALASGNRVELRGFGTFSIKKRGPRTGRNPRTGETVWLSEKKLPVFRAGKEMRKRLNEKPRAG
jgi:integration host factor subunit beta